jgi:transcriptional regulator with XRE-family HTH domain
MCYHLKQGLKMSDSEVVKTIGARIKEARESLSMSKSDFARLVGISMSVLASYENQIKCPSAEMLLRISKGAGIPIEWFYGITDEIIDISPAKTYGELIKCVLKLDIQDMKLHERENGEGLLPDIMLHIDHGFVQSWLRKWLSIKKLHGNGDIDTEFYDLWLAKTLNDDIMSSAIMSAPADDGDTEGLEKFYEAAGRLGDELGDGEATAMQNGAESSDAGLETPTKPPTGKTAKKTKK